MITFLEGDEVLLDRVESLWQQLNRLHMQKSAYFKNQFANFTFAARKEHWLSLAAKGRIYVVIAFDEGVQIGYCLASVVEQAGEIVTLYVEEKYRSLHIGGRLIEMGLEWIRLSGARKISIKVAGGNEEVWPFYAKYGFRPRLTELNNDLD